MTKTITTVPATSTLPDGNLLANDILAESGSAATRALLRKTSSGGTVRKAGGKLSVEPPRVSFRPRGWTMGGRVD